jgi:hypothetical protein
MPLRIPLKLFQPRLPRGARGRKACQGPGAGPFPSIPQTPTQPRTLPAVRVCVHLSHQSPVLVDGGPRLGSQVQERAGAAATAPADPLDDLGVGVGQLRQRAPQLLLVSAGVIASEGAGHGATPPSALVSAPSHPESPSSVLGAAGGGPLNLKLCHHRARLLKAAHLHPQIIDLGVGPQLGLPPLGWNLPHPLHFSHPPPALTPFSSRTDTSDSVLSLTTPNTRFCS